MNYTQLFNESYHRAITCNSVDFFAEFYNQFLRHSDIKKMFSKTNMSVQQRMLSSSVLLLAAFATRQISDLRLEKMAQIHHSIGINERQYDLWIEAILKTLSIVDPLHTPEHSLAWRIMLSPGITYMKYAK